MGDDEKTERKSKEKSLNFIAVYIEFINSQINKKILGGNTAKSNYVNLIHKFSVCLPHRSPQHSELLSIFNTSIQTFSIQRTAKEHSSTIKSLNHQQEISFR